MKCCGITYLRLASKPQHLHQIAKRNANSLVDEDSWRSGDQVEISLDVHDAGA